MAMRLSGAPVRDKILKYILLKGREAGVNAGLTVLRMGEKPEDLAYEKSIIAMGEKAGITVKVKLLDENMTDKKAKDLISEINNDKSIHGVLLLRPMANKEAERLIAENLLPSKDVDGITPSCMAGLYGADKTYFPPCTARACMEILSFYNLSPKGKRVVVIGRSLVIGKPVSMMLLREDATVTICHSKTSNLKEITKNADIVIVAIGRREAIGGEFFEKGQTVIDVGINVTEENKLIGDVNYEEAFSIVDNITPVPGGVGSVTASLLLLHCLQSCLGIIDKY